MAGFNNNFPYGQWNSGAATYPQYSLPTIHQNSQPQPQYQQSQNYITVNGYDDVEKFVVNPNSSILAIDGAKPILYIKSSDSNNVISIHAFSLQEIDINQLKPKTNDDIMQMMQQVLGKVEALEKKVNNESAVTAVKSKQPNSQSNR